MPTRLASRPPAGVLLEHLPEVVLLYDTTGTLLYVNQRCAAWLGWSMEALCTRHLRDIVTAESLPHALANCPLDAEHPGLERRLVYVTQDGRCLEAEVHISPMTFEGQQALLAVARDTTERIQQETQHRQRQTLQAMETLAGGIAHDFNNILAAIMGYSELALADVPAESSLAHYLTSVLTAGRRACTLVQEMLTFSRQHLPDYQPVQLHLWLDKMLTSLRATLPATIAVQLCLTPMVGPVLADPAQLQQVFTHLWSNAVDAMRETGGMLAVRLDTCIMPPQAPTAHIALQPGSYVRLQVRDTGHGMAPEVVERIFEPFFTTKTVGEGIGLGLALVDGIIANHGGAVTVDSTPGQGSAFTVYLPRATPGASTLSPTSARPPSRTRSVATSPLLRR